MKLFRRSAEPTIRGAADLLGIWQLVQSDDLGYQDAELDIREGGRMFYAIHDEGKWAIMCLTYRIEGDTIVSDQPSAPREDRTRFSIEPDGTLILNRQGQRSWFRRGPKRAPEV